MSKRAEQVTKRSTVGARKQAKREARRLRRRYEKLDPENAPRATREVLRGWAD